MGVFWACYAFERINVCNFVSHDRFRYRREASSLFIEIYPSVLLGHGILNMGHVCAIYGSMGHVCAIYGSVTASSLRRNTPTLFLPSYFPLIFLRRLIILLGGMEIVIDSIWRRCVTERGFVFHYFRTKSRRLEHSHHLTI